jgi:hypothetical protein
MNDVLMLGVWDWANTAWRFKRCLEYLGLKVTAFKGQPHVFKYPEELECHQALSRTRTINGFPITATAPELRSWVENSKVIHYYASTFVDTKADLKGKKIVVQHSGVTYSLYADKANELFNPLATYTIMQFPSLLGYGAKNEKLIYYPIDTDYIKPDFEPANTKLVIGHFPSNPAAKGTDKVIDAIGRLGADEKLRGSFEYIGLGEILAGKQLRANHHVSWADNLERMRACDIIIETIQDTVYGNGTDGSYTFTPNGNSRPFGDWGNTCLEAAAMGKVVITNFMHLPVYRREYGEFAPLIANNADELETQLRYVLSLPLEKLIELRVKMRLWAKRNHSIEVTAARLWDKVYRHLV